MISKETQKKLRQLADKVEYSDIVKIAGTSNKRLSVSTIQIYLKGEGKVQHTADDVLSFADAALSINA